MQRPPSPFLIAGAILSAAAALLHLACIAFGAPLYRFVGAGEEMARLAEAGHWYPAFVTTVIASILALWSLYALSGAGVIRRLPLLRMALCMITGVYLLRGVAFPAIVPLFPGNTVRFWVWSSGICLAFGIIHFVGLRQAWPHLRRERKQLLPSTCDDVRT